MENCMKWCRVMGDETRWRIVGMVGERAMCVCELADVLGMPVSTVSSQVQVIRKAGMLESEECGKWTYFRLRAEVVEWVARVKMGGVEGEVERMDRVRVEERLKRREGSCCPGPVRLAE